MKRNITMALALALALAAIALGPLLSPSTAQAQAANAPAEASRSAQPSELSAQRRNRPPTRLRVYPRYAPDSYGVYPRYFPGRNAVRECSATYVEEYRPSGTVITPRMNCFWRRG
jgi:hypothetical protein